MILLIRNILERIRLIGSECAGSMAIETALVAPVLILMSIGGFEVSSMVSRQHELQSGIAEAESVALAANMGAETKTTEVENMLRSSLSLEGEQVKVKKVYRCAAFATLHNSADSCFIDEWVSTYIELEITDTYTPIWSHIGISGPVNYKVERRVQLS